MKLFKLLLAATLVCTLFVMPGCLPDEPEGTCTDGLLNQDEVEVDCGGICPVCTCGDGLLNGGEEDIDCGGPCAPCETCSDGVLNQGEENTDCGGPCPACSSFTEYITAELNGVLFEANLVTSSVTGMELSFESDQVQTDRLSFIVPTDVVPSAYDVLDVGYEANYSQQFEDPYTTTEGRLEILTHDTEKNQITGGFEFVAIRYDGSNPVDTISITNGQFAVEYE